MNVVFRMNIKNHFCFIQTKPILDFKRDLLIFQRIKLLVGRGVSRQRGCKDRKKFLVCFKKFIVSLRGLKILLV